MIVLQRSLLAVLLAGFVTTARALVGRSFFRECATISLQHYYSPLAAGITDPETDISPLEIKRRLLDMIAATPSNMPTSKRQTDDILYVVRQLESNCPTPDQDVVEKLGGNWELLWTAQDQSSDEWGLGPLRTWINPLENQSYSNNPNADQGRANPVLPRPIQDRLEKMGLISQEAEPIRSSQAIDLRKQQVRNVVAFTLPSFGRTRKASLTVSVDFKPNPADKRKLDVKFQACKVAITNSPINVDIPLGIIGPTGWLRTGYIDDTMRITRGHKGSIFILKQLKRSNTMQK